MMKLIKIDRNGSKYYEGMIDCPKCGGSGLIVHHMENGQPSYQWTDGGVCWKCSGSGKVLGKWIERTPEYEAKLAAKRLAKQEAKLAEQKAHADEANAAFFQQQGFNADGKTWVVLGNTFEVKDQLKEAGCKFTGILGWHTDHQLEGYDMLEVDVNECYDKDYAGIYRWNLWKNDGLEAKIKEASQKAIASRSKSQHVGNVGDRIQIKATVTGFHWYTTQFGDVNIYTFTDIFNNVFVWKTSSSLDRIVGNICKPVREGEMVELKATVKGHDEYQGIKQTVLTRCKVVA